MASITRTLMRGMNGLNPFKKKVDRDRLLEFNKILNDYKSAKSSVDSRTIAAENWWKLHNEIEAEKEGVSPDPGSFKSRTAWLVNVIISKHASAMDSFPEFNILPREKGDVQEAKMLSSIIPCILEQNDYEQTYSDEKWQKLKTGTGVRKVIWDPSLLNGLGDISIKRVSTLNLFWTPGITDIQDSLYVFHTELEENELLLQQYPELEGKLGNSVFMPAKFLYDDNIDNTKKSVVIEVYYHTYINGKKILQYCKYVNDVVLFATENDKEYSQRGLYDHGLYPYVFDILYPVEGSPCGYGYIDIGHNPQIAIDLMDTAFVRNTLVGATPRYFYREDGGINENDFLDLTKPLIKAGSNLGDDSLRAVDCPALTGAHIQMRTDKVQEMRETTGNTEVSNGIATNVTAASGIAAQQEASGKGDRDSNAASYRAEQRMGNMIIELIRQFYDLPRQFRITGEYGAQEYVSYSNQNMKLQSLGNQFGQESFRLPVFDIKVSAQRRNAYVKASQNEMALNFFNMGFFNPQMAEQALLCLQMMDFEGIDEVKQAINSNATQYQMLIQFQQLALTLAQKYEPALVPGLASAITGQPAAPTAPATAEIKLDGAGAESTIVTNARERANNVARVDDGEAAK